MNLPIVRLMTVDDHPVVLAGLRTLQENTPDIQIVAEARTGAAALELAESMQPHVVLLDIRLRGENGIDICRQIKHRFPGTRVLMVTSFADGQTVLAAMQAGADGYLLKENDTHHLAEAIREVMRGETVLDPAAVKQMGRNDSSANSGSATPSDEARLLAALTPQEKRLLAEVAQGKTDKEAAVALGLTSKTARNYLDRIFAKLNVHTRTEAATLFVRAQAIPKPNSVR